jgi:hypothetical protein
VILELHYITIVGILSIHEEGGDLCRYLSGKCKHSHKNFRAVVIVERDVP